jgi:hypothetical protein
LFQYLFLKTYRNINRHDSCENSSGDWNYRDDLPIEFTHSFDVRDAKVQAVGYWSGDF